MVGLRSRFRIVDALGFDNCDFQRFPPFHRHFDGVLVHDRIPLPLQATLRTVNRVALTARQNDRGKHAAAEIVGVGRLHELGIFRQGTVFRPAHGIEIFAAVRADVRQFEFVYIILPLPDRFRIALLVVAIPQLVADPTLQRVGQVHHHARGVIH